MEQPAIAAAHKAVGVLLKRQVNVEADAGLAAGTAGGGLLDAAAGTGHYVKSSGHRIAGQLFGQRVAGVALHRAS